MTFSTLVKLLPVPELVYDAVSDDVRWEIAEQNLHLQFPSDYKEFIRTYGSGVVGDRVLVRNPFSPLIGYNFSWNMQRILRGQRVLQEQDSEYLPFPLFPEKGGLLPFAGTYDGDILFWQTEKNNPDTWTILVQKVRSDYYEVYDMTLIGLLLSLLDKRNTTLSKSKIFKGAFKRKSPFQPADRTLGKLLEIIKQTIKQVGEASEPELSKTVVEKIFIEQGFVIMSDAVQTQLEVWQDEKFIEFIGDDNIYLRFVAKP